MIRAAARRRAPVPALAALAALTVLGTTSLAACTAGPSRPDGDRPRASAAPADPAARADLRRFYTQKPVWRPCGELECATLTVPRDYARPSDGKTFVLPLARAAAPASGSGRRIGSLVYNPGGPGERGVQALRDGLADTLGEAVRARFDIVSFDPRGVGESRPALTCLTGAEEDEEETTGAGDGAPLAPRTAAERARVLAAARETADACRRASGAILPHVGTDDAARDLDVLRAVLGDRRLTYVGWSYGTSLGTSYAEQFPHRVRAMVLDGAVDPSLDWRQRALGQSAGFRDAVDAYARSCAEVAGDACPGETEEEIRALIDRLLARTKEEPLPVDGGEEVLDAAGLVAALSLSMYTPEAQWEDLSAALTAADEEGDGTGLAALAWEEEPAEEPEGSGEEPEGSAQGAEESGGSGQEPTGAGPSPSGVPEDNSEAALIAVTCLDVPHPRDPAVYWDALAPAERAAGVYGATGVTDALVCADWPAGRQRPHRVDAPGVPPVLVVGTTGDPSTPYEEAVSLARQFPGGMLLTLDAPGHTGYGRDACVDAKVEAYLVRLAKVRPGSTCAP